MSARIPVAGRVDGNQAELVEYLRRCGCTVEILKFPVDLLVYRKDIGLVLCEVKLPSRKDKLTPQQERIRDSGLPFCVLASLADCSNLLRVGF